MDTPVSNERSSPFWNTFTEVAKSGAVGSGVIGIVTRGLYVKNRIQTNSPIVWADSTKGTMLNGASFVPTMVFQRAANSMCSNYYAGGRNQTPAEQMAITAACGGMAGAVCSTGPEGVVQNYQKPGERASVMQVAKRVIDAGGVPRMWTGGTAMGGREALFAVGYGPAATYVGDRFMPYVGNRVVADTMGAAGAGAVVGAVTNPFDFLRGQKQNAMMEKTVPSYYEIIKREGPKSLMRGASVRAPVVAAATAMITAGNHAVNYAWPKST
jgi:hypothetical protein